MGSSEGIANAVKCPEDVDKNEWIAVHGSPAFVCSVTISCGFLQRHQRALRCCARRLHARVMPYDARRTEVSLDGGAHG